MKAKLNSDTAEAAEMLPEKDLEVARNVLKVEAEAHFAGAQVARDGMVIEVGFREETV